MASAASETYTSVSAPIQHAACVAFDGGEDIEAYLDGSRQSLAALADYVTTTLEGAGAELNPIRGGFYAFPNFEGLRDRLAARGVSDSRSLCSRLLEETGVATLPGLAFGRPGSELSLRLAFVDFDGAQALDDVAGGIGLDRDGLVTIAPRVVEAIDRMAAWVEAK
jgi:aspartate aminotransferase